MYDTRSHLELPTQCDIKQGPIFLDLSMRSSALKPICVFCVVFSCAGRRGVKRSRLVVLLQEQWLKTNFIRTLKLGHGTIYDLYWSVSRIKEKYVEFIFITQHITGVDNRDHPQKCVTIIFKYEMCFCSLDLS